MNRYHFIIFLLIFNIILVLYFWLYWFQIKKLKEVPIPRPPVFVPTKEWQRLEKDQTIPRGLHVRLNLATGEREAKLLSSEDDNEKLDEKTSVLLLDEDINQNDISHENEKYLLLKESLKNIPNEINNNNNEEDNNRVKKFRTYEELKKDMSAMKLEIKTDAELLHGLVENFSKLKNIKETDAQKEDELFSLLKDLEYLLHQVDNAKEFIRINGISDVIVPCLVANSTRVKTAAARALGSAVQNNGAAQIAALKAGVMTPLLKNIELEKEFKVRSSSIYALSCLVRGFPIAEVKLVEEGGLSVLFSLFNENSADAVKLQLKVVTLFNDLLLERDDAELTVEEEKLLNNVTDPAVIQEIKIMNEKLRQYNSVGLNSKLVERGWCSKLSHLLVTKVLKNQSSGINEQYINHDVADKVLNAISAISEQCETQFKNDESFRTVLKNLRDDYKFLLNNDNDSLFKDMYDLLSKLYSKLVV